jgi:hypothetical protein
MHGQFAAHNLKIEQQEPQIDCLLLPLLSQWQKEYQIPKLILASSVHRPLLFCGLPWRRPSNHQCSSYNTHFPVDIASLLTMDNDSDEQYS